MVFSLRVNNITFSSPSAGSTYLLPTSICRPRFIRVVVHLLGFILADLNPRTPPSKNEIDNERQNQSKSPPHHVIKEGHPVLTAALSNGPRVIVQSVEQLCTTALTGRRRAWVTTAHLILEFLRKSGLGILSNKGRRNVVFVQGNEFEGGRYCCELNTGFLTASGGAQ